MEIKCGIIGFDADIVQKKNYFRSLVSMKFQDSVVFIWKSKFAATPKLIIGLKVDIRRL